MWKTGVLTRLCWDGRGLPFSVELEIPRNSTCVMSDSPCSWRSPGPETPPETAQSTPLPGVRHFRAAWLTKIRKRGWHRAQDDLSWQAQNLGSGGGTQICELSSIAARWRYLGPGQKPDVTRWQISFRSLASCYLIASRS